MAHQKTSPTSSNWDPVLLISQVTYTPLGQQQRVINFNSDYFFTESPLLDFIFLRSSIVVYFCRTGIFGIRRGCCKYRWASLLCSLQSQWHSCQPRQAWWWTGGKWLVNQLSEASMVLLMVMHGVVGRWLALVGRAINGVVEQILCGHGWLQFAGSWLVVQSK